MYAMGGEHCLVDIRPRQRISMPASWPLRAARMVLLCRYREGLHGVVLYGQVQGQQLQFVALVYAGQGKMQEMPEGV